MKHFILLAAMGIAALSASAQSQGQCQQQCQSQAACCDSTANCQRQRPARQMRQARVDPFAGIELTTEHRAAVDSIQVGLQSCRQLQQQARRDYLDQLKLVLTPEQYVQYLENIAINGYNQPVGQNRRLRQPGTQFNDSVPAQGQHRMRRQGQRQRTPQQ